MKSLNKLEYPNFEIVIVDNGSSDSSVQVLENFKKQINQYKITILFNEQNLGFGGGNNTGIEYAMGRDADYVLILNNDTTAAPDFLNKLVQEAEKDAKTGLAISSVFFTEPQNLLWFGGKTKFKWYKMTEGAAVPLFKKEMPQNAKPVKIDFATGACMLVKREALEKVRGFFPPYFLYFEDADLSFEIKKAKYDLLWVPDSRIWHKVSATILTKVGSPKMNYYNNRNILLLGYRHGPFWVKYFYMHIWAAYRYLKQLFKIAIGYNTEMSRAIKRGIEDYYKGKFGKYA
jgi:GT2 family glycosyltransferase